MCVGGDIGLSRFGELRQLEWVSAKINGICRSGLEVVDEMLVPKTSVRWVSQLKKLYLTVS